MKKKNCKMKFQKEHKKFLNYRQILFLPILNTFFSIIIYK
ncbi:hypothetical protein [Flavobacterium sp. PS2]